jgi:protein-S-isoprenylcysteine O-methyltransferase Ste14
MNRIGLFLLLVIAPALAICLALLGLETLRHNLTGWILLCLGIACTGGIAIDYHAHHGTLRSLAAGGGKAREPGHFSLWLLLPGFFAMFFASPLEWMYLTPRLPRTAAWQVVGAGIFLAGLVLVIWACIATGRGRFAHLAVADGRPLVDTGPYHFVRHPVLGGLLLMGLGVAIGYSSAVGLAASSVLALPALAYRFHINDQMLGVLYGDVYSAYARRTRRLIPGLW